MKRYVLGIKTTSYANCVKKKCQKIRGSAGIYIIENKVFDH